MDIEEDEKIYNQTKRTICCYVCKNIINFGKFYRRVNPFKKMDRLTENLTDHKLAINDIIKKIEQIKCELLRRKNMEDRIKLTNEVKNK